MLEKNGAVLIISAVIAAFLIMSASLASAANTLLQLKPVQLNPSIIRIRKNLPNLKLPPKKPSHTKVKPGGPDPASAFDLVDMVEDENIISALDQVSGWNPHLLFQDLTIPTLFYYIPRELRLVYDASGYHFRVQYNSLQAQENGSVLVSMDLKAPYHSGDVKVLEKILRQCWDPASEVKALPAFGAEADLENLTAGFGFSGDQIHLTTPSTLRQACSMVISMTPDQAEALIAQMSGPGVSGTLNVPVGERPVSIPVILAFDRFSGEILGGLRQWQQGQKVNRIVNLAMFPVRLTAVNAFVMQGGRLIFQSKALKKSVKIAPKGAKPFRLPSAKRIFGNGMLMAWIDTEIISQCKSCRKEIEKRVRSGIGTTPMETVTFEAIPDIFDRYSIYKLIVEVRSRYFSANGEEPETREIEITGENDAPSEVRLYIPEGAGHAPFSYRLRVISADGREHTQETWQPGTNTHIYIGSFQLAPMLGNPDTSSDVMGGESGTNVNDGEENSAQGSYDSNYDEQ